MDAVNPKINSIDVTSNGSIICMGLSNGYAILETSPLKVITYRKYDNLGIGRVFTLAKSNLVICSGILGQKGFPENKLIVIDQSLGSTVYEVIFNEPIIKLSMTSEMFVAATRSEVRIYTFDPPMVYNLYRGAVNERAPFDIVGKDKSYTLALTGPDSTQIRVVTSIESDQPDKIIKAHNHAVSIIKFNSDGSFIASSSIQGTTVRLFNSKTGDRIAEFRRGTMRADMSSIAISPQMQIIAAASSNPTIHLFLVSGGAQEEAVQRAAMSTKVDDAGMTTLCFLDSTTLLIFNTSGSFRVIKCDIVLKKAEQISNTSLFDVLKEAGEASVVIPRSFSSPKSSGSRLNV